MDINSETSKHGNKKRDSGDGICVAGPLGSDYAFGPGGTPRPRGLLPSSKGTISGTSSESEGTEEDYFSDSDDGHEHLRRQNYDSGTESSDSDVGYQRPKKKKDREVSRHKASSSSESDSDSSQQNRPSRNDAKNKPRYSMKTKGWLTSKVVRSLSISSAMTEH